MTKPKVIVLSGYGFNCEDETKFAFEKAGASADIVHINDLIEKPSMLSECQIFAFPGGFSYGDDTGSGKAIANRIKNNIMDEFFSFIERDVLVLGLCNGFQVMVNLGIVPGFEKTGKAQADLTYNASNVYQCRWVDLKMNEKSPCVFTKGISMMYVPVAHGEGNFYAPAETIEKIKAGNQIVAQYSKNDGTLAGGEFPFNPNGAMLDIASICDPTGRIMGMMPHPERGIFFTQRDDWTLLKEKYVREGKEIPEESDGIKLFQNAVEYFK